MNSVSSGLLGGIMYALSAQAMWNDLHERFDKIDCSISYNLHKEIATLSQGTASVSTYFSKLKDLWEEFEALVPAPGQARSQILLMSPMPTVNQAYAMVISDESQKSVAATAGLLGTNPTTVTGQYDVAMYTKTGGNFQKSRKNFNLFCDFFKIKGNRVGTTNSQNMGQVNNASLLGNCTFTKEQYDHIVQLLNKNNLASSTAPPSANAAGIPCALLASDSLQDWIIDTGAINHMVAGLELLNKASLVQTSQPKKVHLPNGETSQVTPIGTSTLSDQNTITNVFYISQFKYNLLSVSKDAISLATKETEANEEISSSDTDLWHRRLGHVSTTVLKKLVPVKTQDISARIDTCSICPCARCTANKFETIVKIIRTDNGTEFVNSICGNLFNSLGVVHQKTSPYTPQQNGEAERKHRRILELTRAISRKPALLHLKVIGCLRYTKIIQQHDKLMPRSRPSVHMGYATAQKGYLLYDLIDRIFFESKDVQFREGIFPFKNKQGNSQSIFVHPNIENLFHTTDSITYPTSTGSHIHITQQEVLTPPEFTQDLTQHTQSLHSEILQPTTQQTSTIQSPIIQVSQVVPISLPDQPDIRKSCKGKKPPI
nr:uncharacterized protein LOC104101499 [Nicotiana tomentosiformis]